MTDLTDQDRRDARRWADEMNGHPILNENARAAVRVILATVDAPAPTLAERLHYRADILDNGDPDGDTPRALRDLATDAAQMEHDLAEASAEVERLVGHLHTAEHNHAFAAEKWTQMEKERDEARAEVDHLKRDLADAYKTRDARDDEVDRLRAEVERLTAANERLRRTDNYRQFREQFLTVQKGAESNAESPNPADVEPGEAWVVECRGKRRTAVKDRDAAIPWNTVNTSGVFRAENDDDITLLTRLVPARRTITNEDELHRVKRNTVIRDGVGVVCERAALGDGWFTTGNGVDQTPYIKLPATILWEPGHEHEVARLGGHQPRCPPHLQKAPE